MKKLDRSAAELAPARPESRLIRIAAPGVPLVRAVRRLPARSLSDLGKMPSAVQGIQINRTGDIAGGWP